MRRQFLSGRLAQCRQVIGRRPRRRIVARHQFFSIVAFSECETVQPRGDKSSCTEKQKRKSEHIEAGFEDRGISKEETERRAWATVNKEIRGGKKSGSGRGKKESNESSRKGGRKGGSSQSAEQRSAAAKKGWETRRRQGNE